MDRVCVLMSTYNGERFLRDQLESILHQCNVEVSLLIRDDGSTDSTIGIIDEYIRKYQNIRLIKEKNVGPAMSFLELLREAPDADYYAFSDQDDFWMKEKTCEAIQKIREQGDMNQPILYYSNLTLTDSKLKPIRTTKIKAVKSEGNNRYIPLVDNNATGCTIVMTYALRKIIIDSLPSKVTMHDAWCNMVCSLFGKVVFDERSFIYYRQHENNTIGMDTTHNLKKNVLLHLQRVKNKKLQPRLMNAESLLACFGKTLDEKDRRKIQKIVNYKNSLAEKINLLFDFSIHSFSVAKDLRYRLLILLGEI